MNRLEQLMIEAKWIWDLMTPEEQAEHMKAQAVSWVYGNCKLSNPNITREMVEEIVRGEE